VAKVEHAWRNRYYLPSLALQMSGKICGQFVDRIRSTRRTRDGSEWEGMQNPKKFLVAATLEKANT
jgi:hypothetical protein